MAAVVAALRILRVRDWRLYPLAFLWWPVIIGWQSGNLTLLLLLGVALLWRYRDRAWLAGLIAAVLISLKPFLWPLGIWLLATRRYRAAGWAGAVGLGLNLVAWGLVGFDQIGRYLTVDSNLTGALVHDGYGLIAMAMRAGMTSAAGASLLIGVVVMLVAVCAWLGHQRRDATAMLLSIDLTLAASPLVWNHYLALLIVPLAIRRPRIGVEWVFPLLLWLCPGGLLTSEWQGLLALLIVVTLSLMLIPRAVAPVPLRWKSTSDQRRPRHAHFLATTQGGERAG